MIDRDINMLWGGAELPADYSTGGTPVERELVRDEGIASDLRTQADELEAASSKLSDAMEVWS